MSTPILPFAVWDSGTNQNSIPANDNSLRNQILNGLVISDSTDAQPGSPADGDIYIITGAATGTQWATFDEFDLAIFTGGTWYAFAPVDGVTVNLAGSLVAWDGAAYVTVGGGGGGGSPGGSDTQVQFNDGGAFGGDAGFVYNKTTDTLTLVNATFTGLALTVASATGSAGFRLPHGAAPTAPVNGDVWTTTAGMYVRVNGVTVGPLAAAGGGSLTNWTEALATASPNNLVNVASFQAVAGTTNADAAFLKKGTGALLGHIPDGTSAGGNKRGTSAVDWQTVRSVNTQVASGINSVVSGGSANSATTNNSTVAGGSANAATGVGSAIIGGSNNAASGGNSATLGGQDCVADGTSSSAHGNYAIARGIYAIDVMASQRFTASGDAQGANLMLLRASTSATPVTLSSTGGAAGAANQLVLPNNSAYFVKGQVVVREAATGDCACYDISALIKRGANAAATAIVGVPVVAQVFADAGAATWVIAVTADTTNGAMLVTATGEASASLKWSCRLYDVEVVG